MGKIGITERGDASLDLSWRKWVDEGNPAILITKDPARLAKLEILTPKSNVIVHCTITGYGGTKLEPKIPPQKVSIQGMEMISTQLSDSNNAPELAKRVILRIDPIIPTVKGLARARQVIEDTAEIGPAFLERVRISFLDNYPHVKKRFADAGIPNLPYKFHADIEDRGAAVILLEDSEYLPDFEICGEPGMKCTGCISKKDCEVLGVAPASGKSKQRPTCACLSMKHELLDNKKPCKFGCLYCYWKG